MQCISPQKSTRPLSSDVPHVSELYKSYTMHTQKKSERAKGASNEKERAKGRNLERRVRGPLVFEFHKISFWS